MCDTGIEIAAGIAAAAGAAGAGVSIAQAAKGPPKPPPIPPVIPPPKVSAIDTAKSQQYLGQQARGTSTILGGYSGNDANVNRPSLLGR